MRVHARGLHSAVILNILLLKPTRTVYIKCFFQMTMNGMKYKTSGRSSTKKTISLSF